MKNALKQAAEILRNGGIVIFPTDTAYGIGCRVDDEEAVKRLFGMRKRPETKATPVLFSSVKMAEEYLLQIPIDVKEQLMDLYWPGALTIVLPCRVEKVPTLVRGGGVTLGARIPDNEDLISIIQEVGVPIIGTSANFAGEKTPYRFEDLDPELVKVVDHVLPGEVSVKQASTVVDCTVKPWKITREGAVKISFVKS